MNHSRLFTPATAALALLFVPGLAHATVNCTVDGIVEIDSMDSYYCDSDHLSCGDWKETDLDATRNPLPYLRVVFRDMSDGLLGHTSTNASGNYSATFSLPGSSCTGQQVKVRLHFERVHEDYPASFYTRFRVTDDSDNTRISNRDVTLSGSTHTHKRLFTRTDPTPISVTRAANLYFTANSAISEMVTWSTNLNGSFVGIATYVGDLRIRLDYTSPECRACWELDGTGSSVTFDSGLFMAGTTLRHELGHAAHSFMHGNSQLGVCNSYDYNSLGASQHQSESCEWGSMATREGLATFFGVASIVRTGTNAFECWCVDTSNQGICSERAVHPDLAKTTPPWNDRVIDCGGGIDGAFVGVGDTYATGRSHCMRQTPMMDGCATCPDTDSDGECDDYAMNGWRSEGNILRFMWDMIDSNNDNDDTQRTMAQLVGDFEGMSCNAADCDGVGTDTCGTASGDGTCNEAERPTAAACNPFSDFGPAVTPMTGTRDSYNTYDIAQMIPGNQYWERNRNCVDGAKD